MQVTGIDHIQFSMPAGLEDAARLFYSTLLGIPEIPKPPELAKRGGAWFESGRVKIHIGVESDFRPARKAHAGLTVQDLDGLAAKLRAAGFEVTDGNSFAGHRRIYTFDPFGNRLEFIEAVK